MKKLVILASFALGSEAQADVVTVRDGNNPSRSLSIAADGSLDTGTTPIQNYQINYVQQ